MAPLENAMGAGTPVMGIPETLDSPTIRGTYEEGMLDPDSAQMHANALVYGEPAEEKDPQARKSIIPDQ